MIVSLIYKADLATFQHGFMAYVGSWKTNQSKTLTCIYLFGEWYLYHNLRVAMLKEVVGMGPERYCVVFNRSPSFYSKLKLILNLLPQEKMFIYPEGAVLGGPFLHELWLSRGHALCSRPSLNFEEYHANFVAPHP